MKLFSLMTLSAAGVNAIDMAAFLRALTSDDPSDAADFKTKFEEKRKSPFPENPWKPQTVTENKPSKTPKTKATTTKAPTTTTRTPSPATTLPDTTIPRSTRRRMIGRKAPKDPRNGLARLRTRAPSTTVTVTTTRLTTRPTTTPTPQTTTQVVTRPTRKRRGKKYKNNDRNQNARSSYSAAGSRTTIDRYPNDRTRALATRKRPSNRPSNRNDEKPHYVNKVPQSKGGNMFGFKSMKLDMPDAFFVNSPFMGGDVEMALEEAEVYSARGVINRFARTRLGEKTCWSCAASSYDECASTGSSATCINDETACYVREYTQAGGQIMVYMGCQNVFQCVKDFNHNDPNAQAGRGTQPEVKGYHSIYSTAAACRPGETASVCHQCCANTNNCNADWATSTLQSISEWVDNM